MGSRAYCIAQRKEPLPEQLAFQAGVSGHFMYQLENNLASPTVKTLEKLANALRDPYARRIALPKPAP